MLGREDLAAAARRRDGSYPEHTRQECSRVPLVAATPSSAMIGFWCQTESKLLAQSMRSGVALLGHFYVEQIATFVVHLEGSVV